MPTPNNDSKTVRFFETGSLSSYSDESDSQGSRLEVISAVSAISCSELDSIEDLGVSGLPTISQVQPTQTPIDETPLILECSSIDLDGTAVFTMQDLEIAFAKGSKYTHQYYSTEVSPNVFPSEILNINSLIAKDINIGDLHGNALAMVHYLIKIGLFQIEKSLYQELVETYSIIGENKHECNPIELNDSITKFCNSVNSIIVKHPDNRELQQPLIRFLGDMLCDRGANDFLTLVILRKLHEEQVNYEIIWSNHDSLFLQEFYLHIVKPQGFGNHSHSLITKVEYNDYFNSLFNMQDCMLNQKITSITKDNIKDLVEKYYLPYLNLIRSVLRADKILDVFTHAPICLSQIIHNNAVQQIWRDRQINFSTVLSDANEFSRALEFLNDFFKQNIVGVVRAINFHDAETKHHGDAEKFTEKTGLKLELVLLINSTLANQRYFCPLSPNLLQYYLANPNSCVTFNYRKFNGHDTLDIPDLTNPTIKQAFNKLKTSVSFDSRFGKAQHISQRATILVASSLTVTARPCLITASQVQPVSISIPLVQSSSRSMFSL